MIWLLMATAIFLVQPWLGIWSLYTAEVENHKVLVCHYCPINVPSLLVLKDRPMAIVEVAAIAYSKASHHEPEKIGVRDYSLNSGVAADSGKVVPADRVEGRVLYVFPG